MDIVTLIIHVTNKLKPMMEILDISVINNEMFFPNNYCITEVQCALGSILLDRG